LDARLGKGQYLTFLSADHGVLQVPGFLQENKIPAGLIYIDKMVGEMNALLKSRFDKERLVKGVYNYQVLLDHFQIRGSKLNEAEVKQIILDYLSHQPQISRAFEIDKLMQTTLNAKVRDMLANGYYPKRSGSIQIIFQPQWIEAYGSTGTTHGLWNPYDAHIPLLWYGWNIKPGKTNREVYMTDIAPTLAACSKYRCRVVR
jgi:hypothetical protein